MNNSVKLPTKQVYKTFQKYVLFKMAQCVLFFQPPPTPGCKELLSMSELPHTKYCFFHHLITLSFIINLKHTSIIFVSFFPKGMQIYTLDKTLIIIKTCNVPQTCTLEIFFPIYPRSFSLEN